MRKAFLFLIVISAPVLLLGALFAGAAGARTPRLPLVPPPQWGRDIPVNQAPVPRPTISAARNPMLAIRPTSPNVVIAGYDSQEEAQVASGYARSSDAGQTWTSGRFTGPWGDQGMIPIGNASVAYDGFGTGYYVSQAVTNTYSAYFLLTTTVGLDWSTPKPIAIYDGNEYRSWATLVADPRTSGPYAGSLYLFWCGTKNVAPYYLGVLMRYSRDGGRTWSADIPVSDPGDEFAYMPFPTVAADGSVNVAFAEVDDFYIGNPPRLFFDRSTDGGQTWGQDRLIGGSPITPIGRPDWKGHELALLTDADCQLVKINHFPAISVAPSDPQTIYAVWNDGRWEPKIYDCGNWLQHSDIAFSRSTDGGISWSAPLRLNDDPLESQTDHFNPNIAVYPDGTVGAVWYDRRADPNHYLYDLYYSQSNDGGLTWSANQRVSDVSSNADQAISWKGIADVGYRTGLAFGPNYALAGWLDTRAGTLQADFYVDHGVLTPPTPTATATATATPTLVPPTPIAPSATPHPPSATATATATPCAPAFSDVHPTDYFYTPVRYLACQGVFGGYADGTFRPYNPTTRGQLSKMVVNGFGWSLQTPPTPTFIDVPAAHPYYAFVETAVAHGAISGYVCGGAGEPCPGRYFRPGANVTRGQLSKIIVTAEGWLPLAPPVPSFADVPASSPFFGYVERAAAEGVLSGYGCGGAGEPCPGRYFRPAADSTRGQLGKILYNVLARP